MPGGDFLAPRADALKLRESKRATPLIRYGARGAEMNPEDLYCSWPAFVLWQLAAQEAPSGLCPRLEPLVKRRLPPAVLCPLLRFTSEPWCLIKNSCAFIVPGLPQLGHLE